jgi:hypothetical protein
MSPMGKYRMAQWAAALNFVGALLVFLSFQATSSDFFLTTLKDGRHAICVGKTALMIWSDTGVGAGIRNGCADVTEKPKVAIVTVESPAFSILGWLLLLLGFVLPVFSVEKPQPRSPTPQGKSKTNPYTGLPHSKNWRE